MKTTDFTSLVADIGGTHTRIALARNHTLIPATVKRFENRRFSGPNDLLSDYLKQVGNRVDAVCVALAGPIKGSSGTLTNLDWTVKSDPIRRACNSSEVYLLNDLQAQGYAVATLPSNALQQIRKGAAAAATKAEATKIVIGIGTGFNAAPIRQAENGVHVDAMEWGHMTLPVTSGKELALCEQITQRLGFASIEDVLSGRGLEEIDRWLHGPHPDRAAQSSAMLFARAAEGEATAIRSLRMAGRLLGHVAGDLALAHIACGGVYLTGGVARRLAPYLTGAAFEDSFCSKGRFASSLTPVPVYVVLDDFAALTGCVNFLLQKLSSTISP